MIGIYTFEEEEGDTIRLVSYLSGFVVELWNIGQPDYSRTYTESELVEAIGQEVALIHRLIDPT